MPDNRSQEDLATSGKPVSYKDDDDNDPEFVEVDPTGRYGRYNEVLGKGAFKTVYRAFDEVDGIEVAWNQVKVQDVLQSPEDLERLYSEVHLLKTLKHKNIIKFYNSWVDAKTKNVNFITEIFTSGTLRQYRKKHKHVDLKAVKSWARQILRGLLYLHSHDPPIIHRDLKCDNIFVNGNQGEVKIGDLGLAAILRQAHAAHSVIGTPEFMAPELYEEEYNELVDIYSFGMCVLEMVTFEYPYSECINAAQIYKKVTSGKKPAALDKVKDPEVRSFVEKCLAAASRRLPARELLMDPFLQCDGDRETLDLLPPRRLQTRADDMEELGTLLEEQYRSNAFEGSGLRDCGRMLKGSLPPLKLGSLTSFDGGDSKAEDEVAHNNDESMKFTKNSSFSSSRDERFRRSRDFRVKGKRREDDTIFLRLRIGDHEGHFRNIHFPFDIEADTALSVASEMVAELDLSDQDVTTIAEMIDAEILALVPDWKPGAAFDESVGIDGENSPDQPSEPFVTSRTDENFIHSKSPSEPPSFSHGGCSQSPSQLPNLSVASPARAEFTIHGRFEEVSYRSGASDHSFQSEEFPAFSSDSCDAQDEETLDGGFSCPDTPNSDAYRSSTEPPFSGALAQDAKHVSNKDMQLVSAAMDELKNSELHDTTDENWEKVVLNAVQEEHALKTTVVSDECMSLECPKLVDRLDIQAYVDHEINQSLVSGVVLAADDNLEDSVAEELRTLAVRQEQELKELQHKHELALLEIQKRCQNKRSSSPLRTFLAGQENTDFAYSKVASSSAQVSANQSPQLEGNLQDVNHRNFASSRQDDLSSSFPNASADNSGKDQNFNVLHSLSVSESSSSEIEESSKQELFRNNHDEKPRSISISREVEADIIAQEQVGKLLNCIVLKSFQAQVETRTLMDQPQLRNESRIITTENCDLEYALNASDAELQKVLGCDLLSKGLSEESLDSNVNAQHTESLLSKVVGTAADCRTMGASMTWDSKVLASDVKEDLLAESHHPMPAALIAPKSTSDMSQEDTEEIGPRVAALPILGNTHLDSVKVESLLQNRRDSFVEYYKAGCLERDKSCSTKGVLKGLEGSQCETNVKTASLESTEAGRLEQQKKEQLQKSIAELEARTLQGLHSSQTRYAINSGKKTAGGSAYGGQTALSKSQVRQQTAAEPNKA